MKNIRYILVFIFYVNYSFIWSYECNPKPNESCFIMKENIHDFLIKIRGLKDQKYNYSENREELECNIIELVKSECELDQRDSIRARIQYYFGVYSSYVVGDLDYYKNIFNNSLINLDKERTYLSNLQNTDEDQRNRLEKRRNDNSNLFLAVRDSLKALNHNYADIDLYLDSDSKLSEMAKVIHKNTKDKSVVIKINAPPKLFSDKKHLNRINYLQKFPIAFNLTSYNEEKGFHCKIPLVPVKLIRSARSIKPKDTYTLSFSGDKRYRFEFYRDREGNLSKVPKIKMNNTSWQIEETLPPDWTKLEIPKEVSWKYKTKTNKKVVAQWNSESERFREFDKNINDHLIIDSDINFIIYQRLYDRKQKMDYELIIDKKESWKWLRQSLAPMFSAIVTLIAYQTL